MARVCYKSREFKPETLAIIRAAERLLDHYQTLDVTVTLRTLYYRFIAMDLFPETWIDQEYNQRNGLELNTKNTQKNYKRLGSIVADGRMAGLLDWDFVEDLTREPKLPPHWNDPANFIAVVAPQFRINKWVGQPQQVEVWIEKDAIEGVLAGVCRELDVPLFACRGYSSLSSMREAARRLLQHREQGREPVILHLGDHDPSGVDMSRDLEDRLKTFMFGDGAMVCRIAPTREQIEQYDPPPNPAKATDSRFSGYEAEHGTQCWEVDALEPEVLIQLVRDEIGMRRDDEIYAAREAEEDTGRELLAKTAANWPRLVRVINRY